MRHRRYRLDYWTRARVLDGLRHFYRERGIAPTASQEWQDATRGTAISQHGVGNPYPSSYGVLKHFKTFREAWKAAGVWTNRDWEEWTPEEDWFISEAAGLITRNDMAAYLDRTPCAVHRRLYDLGINTRTARGWSLTRCAAAARIKPWLIRQYMNRGALPYLRGCTLIYFDPADLLVIKEIDWSNVSAELVEAARRSLMTRLVKIVEIIAGRDCRAESPYRAQRQDSASAPRSVHRRSASAPATAEPPVLATLRA